MVYRYSTLIGLNIACGSYSNVKPIMSLALLYRLCKYIVTNFLLHYHMGTYEIACSYILTQIKLPLSIGAIRRPITSSRTP